MLRIFHRERRAIRIAVFLALTATMITTFLVTGPLWERVRIGELPIWTPLVAPGLFTLFVLIFGLDRYIQVRRGNYPAGRAMLQIGLALVFLAFLWPKQAEQLRAARNGSGLQSPKQLLKHHEPSVRALACRALANDNSLDVTRIIAQHIEFELDERVQAQCQAMLREREEF